MKLEKKIRILALLMVFVVAGLYIVGVSGFLTYSIVWLVAMIMMFFSNEIAKCLQLFTRKV